MTISMDIRNDASTTAHRTGQAGTSGAVRRVGRRIVAALAAAGAATLEGFAAAGDQYGNVAWADEPEHDAAGQPQPRSSRRSESMPETA